MTPNEKMATQAKRIEELEAELTHAREQGERERKAATFAIQAADAELTRERERIATLEDELAEARAAVRGLARTLAEELNHD